jgi:hypothetical protein
MTNQDKWNSYTDGLPSPQNFIDWSWYYIISASLQRRVWLGPSHQPCYGNGYTILVGSPGVGKGLVLKEVCNILKHWTLDMSKGNEKLAKTPEQQAVVDASVSENIKHASETEFQGNQKGPKDLIKPLLIPVCADSITCEALIKAISEAYRYINHVEVEGDKPKIKAYGHSSLCFVLPELSSLMKKNTQNTNNFLLSIYDCPIDHEYVSITRGKDRIRRGCLNIIAGTTPSFMQTTFSEDLIGEGFSSRTHYIYATKNRKNAMWLPKLTPEQEQHKKDILEHIRKLTTIYGPLRMSQETTNWMQEWWDNYCKVEMPKNKHPEMVPYDARMNIHVMKIAMAIHFSEDAEQDEYGRPKNEITINTFKKAIQVIAQERPNMHLALILEGKSPESKASQKILELLQGREQTYIDVLIACHKVGANRAQTDEAIEYLKLANQIQEVFHSDPNLIGKEILHYKKL